MQVKMQNITLRNNNVVAVEAENGEGDKYLLIAQLDMVDLGRDESRPGMLTFRLLSTTATLKLPAVRIE